MTTVADLRAQVAARYDRLGLPSWPMVGVLILASGVPPMSSRWPTRLVAQVGWVTIALRSPPTVTALAYLVPLMALEAVGPPADGTESP